MVHACAEQPPAPQGPETATVPACSDASSEEDADESPLRLNTPLPSRGGKQFWTDHRGRDGWRLQHNVVTDHWRVFDPANTRRAGGHGHTAGCRLQPAAAAGICSGPVAARS
jgi:hypothetical protein